MKSRLKCLFSSFALAGLLSQGVLADERFPGYRHRGDTDSGLNNHYNEALTDEDRAELELPEVFDSIEDDLGLGLLDALEFEAGNACDGFYGNGTAICRYKSSLALFPSNWPDATVFNVNLQVSRANQTLSLIVNGDLVQTFTVSTGKKGHATPRYNSVPVLKQNWKYRSFKYRSPMNWATFLSDAIAIHSTPASNYKYLGKPASHGCIRMTDQDAYYIYNYVQKYRDLTRIDVL